MGKTTDRQRQWIVWRYAAHIGEWQPVGVPRNRYEAIQLAKNLRMIGDQVQVRKRR